MSTRALSRFLSCDWGTTAFRLRWVVGDESDRDAGRDLSADGYRWRVLREIRTEEGAKTIHTRHTEQAQPGPIAGAFARVLANAIRELDDRQNPIPADAPVLISGMASSTVGWKELPYAEVPCGIDGEGLRVERMEASEILGPQRVVWMVSGLKTGRDIMRGEETELVGILGLPSLARLRDGCRVLLPGTHSKHVRVERGRIVDFRTYMTGELLEVLSTQSLLRVSVSWPPPTPGAMPDPGSGDAMLWQALEEGVRQAEDGGLSRGLFRVRTRSVLERTPSGANAWFLAGLVMGAEVMDLLSWHASLPIVLAGGPHFSARYRRVFETLGAAERLVVVPPESLVESTMRAHAALLVRASAVGRNFASEGTR